MEYLFNFLNDHEVLAVLLIFFLLAGLWFWLEIKNAPTIDDEYNCTASEQANSLIMDMMVKYSLDQFSATIHAKNNAERFLKEWEMSNPTKIGPEYRMSKIKFWEDVVYSLERRIPK